MERTALALVAVAALTIAAACGGEGGRDAPPRAPGADLSHLRVETITVGTAPVAAWIADTPATRGRGLMDVTPEQLAPLPDGTERGMLFVFPSARRLRFFMRNTYVPLDLAYAATDGTILEVHALAPLDETTVTSSAPAAFALEVRAGMLATRGLGPGDRLTTGATATE
jgi:hypothetical protein